MIGNDGCGSSSSALFTCTVEAEGPLGLYFSPHHADTSCAFTVQALAEGGLCLQDPRVMPGCVLTAVQGESLIGLSYKMGLARIRGAGRPVRLTKSQPAAATRPS